MAKNDYLEREMKELQREQSLISDNRKKELQDLAATIKEQLNDHDQANITFICTHNSRRSQLAELWLRTAAHFYSLETIKTFSGGTETTAFNYRMVEALVRAGFSMEKKGDEDNPTFYIQLDEEGEPERMFSKKYDDPFNPSKNFIAVMVCSQANEECPFVPDAYARIALPYKDPKHADGTPKESFAYDDKVREIGREMIFLARLLVRNMH